MIGEVQQKENLEKCISLILEDEDNMQSFTFFLNRLENIRITTDEIKHVLEDYLCISEDLPVEGKNRVKHISDRHVLKCKETIGYIDARKIEIIANAVLNNTEVKLPITIHDFKRRYKKNILRNDEWGEKYRNMMNKYQENDEIIEFISPRWTWKQLCGRSFVVLERNGKTIVAILKSMN